ARSGARWGETTAGLFDAPEPGLLERLAQASQPAHELHPAGGLARRELLVDLGERPAVEQTKCADPPLGRRERAERPVEQVDHVGAIGRLRCRHRGREVEGAAHVIGRPPPAPLPLPAPRHPPPPPPPPPPHPPHTRARPPPPPPP